MKTFVKEVSSNEKRLLSMIDNLAVNIVKYIFLMTTRRSDAATQRLSHFPLLLRKRLLGLDPGSFTPTSLSLA